MAQSITLKINGQSHTVEAEPDVPLLWVIREYLQMTGTSLAVHCPGGACTVHLDGHPCVLSASGQPGGGS